jgi:prophage regulatory protein
MTKSATLKVTVIEQNDWLEGWSRGPLTQAQKDLVKLVAREAVQEFIRETRHDTGAPNPKRVETSFPETGYVRLPQILKVIPLCRTCWWEGVKSGRFPKPVKLSARCTAWRAEDIRELIKNISGRDTKA